MPHGSENVFRSRKLFQIGDDIRNLVFLFEARESHFVSLYRCLWIGKILREFGVIPHQPILTGFDLLRRILETRVGAGSSSYPPLSEGPTLFLAS